MLGDNILKLRKKSGLSQEELSEKISVTRQTISNWELNETQPNPEQLKLLSKAFNVSVDELIGNDIKSVIEEKVIKTEKTTGQIYKFTISIGISIILIGILMIGIDFYFGYRGRTKNETTSIEMTCSMNNENYIIDMRSNNYFKCVNCPDDLKEELNSKYFDSGDLEKSARNIEFYIKEHGGSCEQ